MLHGIYISNESDFGINHRLIKHWNTASITVSRVVRRIPHMYIPKQYRFSIAITTQYNFASTREKGRHRLLNVMYQSDQIYRLKRLVSNPLKHLRLISTK